jgi:hypothetical protein
VTTPRLPAVALAIVTVLLLGACVSPAPTTAVFEAKAGLTASDATSAARTAVLAVETFRAGNLTAAALEVLLQESEASLDSVGSTFDSVQPPRTAAADDLRRSLDDLLSQAQDDARELRIAARRDDRAELRSSSGSLAQVATKLDAFAQEHAE